MRLIALALFAQVIVSPAAIAGEAGYSELKCADVANHPSWAQQLVGWIDLRGWASDKLAFEKADADAKALQRTCSSTPDLHLHKAASFTFYELDSR